MAHLLLVEDDSLIRRMISLRLQSRGHTLETAENGAEGLQMALAGSFDAVLMDMHMPVMDGHEAVRQLRQENYRGLIVAVTASAMSRDSEAAMEAGCDAFLSKPITPDFEDQIEKILDDETTAEDGCRPDRRG